MKNSLLLIIGHVKSKQKTTCQYENNKNWGGKQVEYVRTCV